MSLLKACLLKHISIGVGVQLSSYIYSSPVKYKFKVFVLYLSISILCSFILLLYYISDANIASFTPLNLTDILSC